MKATIAAYDALIASPAKQAAKWKNYGCFGSCRLCKAMANPTVYMADCPKCPLGPKYIGCVSSTTYDRLRTAIYRYTQDRDASAGILKAGAGGQTVNALIRVAETRRQWLIRKFNKFCGETIF